MVMHTVDLHGRATVEAAVRERTHLRSGPRDIQRSDGNREVMTVLVPRRWNKISVGAAVP